MTSMSGASDSVSRMPRRISAWSSQRNTLIIGCPSPFARASQSQRAPLARIVGVGHRRGRYISELRPVQGHRQYQARARATAAELDPAADGAGALLQAADAERARLRQIGRAEAA